MSSAAGRGLVDDRGQPRAAARGDHDAVGAGTLCAADDRTEVVGIADLVADDHKGFFVPLCGKGENIIDRAVLPHGAKRDHTLVGMRRAHKIELAPIALNDNDARGTRL